MVTIEFAYLLSSSIAVLAMAPQVKKLITAGRSDELSLISWLVWTGGQVVGLVYSISVHLMPFIIIGSIWVAYYVAMVCLIIWFRHRPRVTMAHPDEHNLIEDTALVGSR